MPGRNNSTNKYGWSAFTVSPVLGDGGNYSLVQNAIDDCFATGIGGVVLIRKGLYTENLILRAGVDLIGADVDGRVPAALSHVVLRGNHTFTAAAGVGLVIAENITFEALVGDSITLTATTGAQLIMACKFCGVEAVTDPASRAVVLDADAASGAQFSTDNSNFNSASHTFEAIGAGNGSASLSLGAASSSTGDIFRLSVGSATLAAEYMSTVSAAGAVFTALTAAANVIFAYSNVSSSNEAVTFPAGGGLCTASHCRISSGAASGFWIDGTGGQVDFVDIALVGSAQDIGPLVIQSKLNWQPYSEAAAVPLASNRGTSSYDSTQFVVTDGWVQTLFSGIFPWVDQGASTTVVSNQGNFATAAIALTLPAAPIQGDTCKFKCTTGAALAITANVGQTLQVGNQLSGAGGTATSTDVGDTMDLTFHAASARWQANSIIGNWVVV